MHAELSWLPEPALSWNAALNAFPAGMAVATTGNAALVPAAPLPASEAWAHSAAFSKHWLGGLAVVQITHGTADDFAARRAFMRITAG